MIPLAYFLVLFSFTGNAVEAAIGINWGRHTAQRLIPSQAVDLILQNGIKEARVYSAQDDILEAFGGSGIELTVTLFQIDEVNTKEKARAYVEKRMPYFMKANVRRILFGNQIFNQAWNTTYMDAALKTFEIVTQALKESGHGDDVKLTAAHDTQLILSPNITKPSEAEFRNFVKEPMIKFAHALRANNAPFIIEVFPISRVLERGFEPSFAFPDNKSSTVIKDVKGAVYTNYIEFEYDCIAWALDKINASDLKIVYGQMGWPTDGFPGANVSSAERFYKSLLPFVVSNKGTPRRPGKPIDTYLHALTDENRTPAATAHSRHWGIYRSNGQPKFKIDLSGQGRDIFPVMARGINRMPERWCVFNGNLKEVYRVKNMTETACKKADCTATLTGGSCSQLDFPQNVSYAFNMVFQFKFQDDKECDFEGFGKIVLKDPSVGSCVFPVEVVRGEQDDFSNYLRMSKYALPSGGNRIREYIWTRSCAIYVFLLFYVLGVALHLY